MVTRPIVLVVAGLAALVAAAFVGGGEMVGSLTLAMVGAALVVVGVVAAEPWKAGQRG